jgi:gliding motility-associated-like protein
MFRPNSEIAENRVFKPVHSYVNAEEYVFSIFDRWGSRVFYTNDITEGWDGSFNGKMATPGVYTYIITYRIDKKNVFKKQGRVTLIR